MRETPEQTVYRRARALEALHDMCPGTDKIARVIRDSDEAAGMALVTRSSVEEAQLLRAQADAREVAALRARDAALALAAEYREALGTYDPVHVMDGHYQCDLCGEWGTAESGHRHTAACVLAQPLPDRATKLSKVLEIARKVANDPLDSHHVEMRSAVAELDGEAAGDPDPLTV